MYQTIEVPNSSKMCNVTMVALVQRMYTRNTYVIFVYFLSFQSRIRQIVSTCNLYQRTKHSIIQNQGEIQIVLADVPVGGILVIFLSFSITLLVMSACILWKIYCCRCNKSYGGQLHFNLWITSMCCIWSWCIVYQ